MKYAYRFRRLWFETLNVVVEKHADNTKGALPLFFSCARLLRATAYWGAFSP
jgi:hypothetical protein